MKIENGKTYRVRGKSKYFLFKYGTSNPEIIIEAEEDFRSQFNPPAFLFIGRGMSEGLDMTAPTYYGHIKGLGEFVSETELEEMRTKMTTNPCAKTVTRDKAYEVWQSYDGSWTWYVLKKYQSPENEAKNPYAKWFCDVVTPIVPDGELGDVYVRDIVNQAKRIK